jgi:cytochrome b561
MSKRTGYSRLQIGLHWLLAILIPMAWLSGEGMERALRERIASGATGFEGNTGHVWLGGAIFALVVVRILVRLFFGAPEPEAALSPLHRKAALWGHRVLYGLMILVPALGAATWYLGLRDLGEVHETLGSLLMWVVLGHSLAAIYHHWRSGHTLMRMVRPER